MFGFLKPNRANSFYRRAYCRCCEHQRQNYGIVSVPLLTYESTFAYLMAMDAAPTNATTLDNQRCCLLRRQPTQPSVPDADLGRFAASLGILLRSIKLDDDIRDRQSIVARTVRRLIAKKSDLATGYFSSLDSDFSEKLQTIVNDHHKMEEASNSVALAQYSEPTARAYGYVLGLLGQLPGLSDYRTAFTCIGEKIGAATVAFDAAVDWKRDKRRGEFNPILTDAQAVSAIAFSQSCLRDASDLCSTAFGPGCRSSQVLIEVHNRVYKAGKARWPKLAAFLESACVLPQPQREGIVLYFICCYPCGDGTVVIDSDEFGRLGCVLICCCIGCHWCCS